MNKKTYYLLRTLQISGLIIIGSVIIYQFSMLKSKENKIKYQQTEQFAYSLTNLASSEITRYLSYKNEKDLQLLINELSHNPVIRDATVYDNLGQILYQSENVLPLANLLKINTDNAQQEEGAVPYIAELYKDNRKIGYIRITLVQEKILGLIQSYKEKNVSTMWLLSILSFIAGAILMMLFFRRLENAYSHTKKELYRLIKENSVRW